MKTIKLLFLIFTLHTISAWSLTDIFKAESISDITGGRYRFRCYFACVDQTGTQNDYVEQRDHCRELAQLKVEMAMKEANQNGEDASRKNTLVSLFSECMAANGWTVPDGKDPNRPNIAASNLNGGTITQPINAVSAATLAKPGTIAERKSFSQQEQAYLTRNAECAFARSNANVSSIQASRAKACDHQCAEGLRVAPSAPRPAACPPETNSKYRTGNVN